MLSVRVTFKGFFSFILVQFSIYWGIVNKTVIPLVLIEYNYHNQLISNNSPKHRLFSDPSERMHLRSISLWPLVGKRDPETGLTIESPNPAYIFHICICQVFTDSVWWAVFVTSRDDEPNMASAKEVFTVAVLFFRVIRRRGEFLFSL